MLTSSFGTRFPPCPTVPVGKVRWASRGPNLRRQGFGEHILLDKVSDANVAPVEVGNLSHYLRRVLAPSQGGFLAGFLKHQRGIRFWMHILHTYCPIFSGIQPMILKMFQGQTLATRHSLGIQSPSENGNLT